MSRSDDEVLVRVEGVVTNLYSIAPLASLPVEVRDHAYTPKISS